MVVDEGKFGLGELAEPDRDRIRVRRRLAAGQRSVDRPRQALDPHVLEADLRRARAEADREISAHAESAALEQDVVDPDRAVVAVVQDPQFEPLAIADDRFVFVADLAQASRPGGPVGPIAGVVDGDADVAGQVQHAFEADGGLCAGLGAGLGHEVEFIEPAGVFDVHAIDVRFAAQPQLAVDNLRRAAAHAPAFGRLPVEKRDPGLLGGVDRGGQQADKGKEERDDRLDSHDGDRSRGVGGRDLAIIALILLSSIGLSADFANCGWPMSPSRLLHPDPEGPRRREHPPPGEAGMGKFFS